MSTNNPPTSATALTSSASCSVSLGFDVLFSVMPWIRKRSDLYSFIVTCSDLYRTGIPILLGFHCHITARSLPSFYAFLLSRASSSFLGLRSLDLYFPTRTTSPKLDPAGFDIITDIISRAKRLRYIKIDGVIKNENSTAYQALSALQALESLDLGNCEDYTYELRAVLAQLRSPLTSLMVQLSIEDADMTVVFSNFRQTLQRLAISGYFFCRAAPVDFNYPNLTYLSLENMINIQLSVLVPAFPNLKHLSINYPHYIMEATFVFLHANNRQFQQEHPNQAWHLSSLTGAVGVLYALGLQTVVPVVTITSFKSFSHADLSRLRAILTQLQPAVLSVLGGDEPTFQRDWTADWLATVIAESCRELVRLDLKLAFYRMEPVSEHKERFDVLFRGLHLVHLSNPALSFLCVEFKAELDHPPSEAGQTGYGFVDALDMLSLVNRAPLAIPSLKISRFSRDRLSYWIYKENDAEITHVPPERFAFMSDLLKEKTESAIRDYTAAVDETVTRS